LKWTDAQGWLDRDGEPPPSPLLAWKIDELLRRWKDNQHDDIFEKPLPDPELLNAAIPQNEWEESIDGKPRPPWQRHYAVYFVDPGTGRAFRYEAATVGARIAWETLREAVINMRLLRGDRCLPLVRLADAP
jgi:hypothetical protein